MSEESDSQLSSVRLSSLRRELDGIDAQILENVRRRLDVCTRVAGVKREFDIPMMQPGRVGLVQERARDFARAHDMSEEFFVALYDLLIGEACRVEDLIIDAESAAGDRR